MPCRLRSVSFLFIILYLYFNIHQKDEEKITDEGEWSEKIYDIISFDHSFIISFFLLKFNLFFNCLYIFELRPPRRERRKVSLVDCARDKHLVAMLIDTCSRRQPRTVYMARWPRRFFFFFEKSPRIFLHEIWQFATGPEIARRLRPRRIFSFVTLRVYTRSAVGVSGASEKNEFTIFHRTRFIYNIFVYTRNFLQSAIIHILILFAALYHARSRREIHSVVAGGRPKASHPFICNDCWMQEWAIMRILLLLIK